MQYYNTDYDSPNAFTIQLQPNTTYTLSNTMNSSSVEGGRNNEANEYGALDIEPSSGVGPLIIAGGPGTVLTCVRVGPNSDVPLDRLIHVLSGTVAIQGMTLEGGLALDNGTGSAATDALGGGVLVNPGGTLSLTNCSIRSNAASGSTGAAGSSGLNAAGGGVYASAGSTINLNGSTSFTSNQAIAGKGGSTGGSGSAGGVAFGGGLAVAAPVSEPPATTQSVPATTVSMTAQAAGHPIFESNRLNLRRGTAGTTSVAGGTGGAGSTTGGAGGSAYGGGLYLGTGQLNINGGSLASAVVFLGNQARAGAGAAGGTTPGEGGSASGPGAYLAPGQILLTNAPTSGGIFNFSNNTRTSYSNGTASTTTDGLDLPPVLVTTDPGYTSPDGPWNLRTAVAAANALISSGIVITLTLPALSAGQSYTLASSASGPNTGSLAVSGSATGFLRINGGGAGSTVINASSLGASVFAISSANVKLSNLTITGANAVGNGGALNLLDSDVTLSNLVVSSNTSTGNGGGIYQSGGSLRLVNCRLFGNGAAGSGGGLYSQDASTLAMVNVTVSSNQVNTNGNGGGGGLYLSGGTLNATGLTVQNNQVIASGGGTIEGGGIAAVTAYINFNGGTSAATVVSNNRLKGAGSGSGFGGGISLENGSLVVNSSFSNSGNRISSVGVGVGGAIAFFSNSSYNVLGSVTMSGNTAVNGGNDYAFMVTSPVDGNNTNMYGPLGINVLTGGGGSLRSAISYCENEFGSSSITSMAIMLAPATYSLSAKLGSLVTNIGAGDSLTIIGLGGPVAVSGGGQVRDFYVENSGTLMLQSLTITGGYSSSQGGGLYQNSGTLVLTNVNVTGNLAGPRGAAVNDFPVPSFTVTYPTPRTALTGASGSAGYGGGVYMNGGTLNLVGSTQITGNTVQGQNGAPGQNGVPGSAVFYSVGLTATYPSLATYANGQNGGVGGAGGAALGGGLYQAGGTLNLPPGASPISGNVANPGAGGAGGMGGAGAVSNGQTVGSPGQAGAPGAAGASVPNLDNANGVLNASTAGNTPSAQVGPAAAGPPDARPSSRPPISPARFTGSYKVIGIALGGHSLSDYLLLTRTGKPRLFLADGRTGSLTPIAGPVGAHLRKGVIVQKLGSGKHGQARLALLPANRKSGRVAVVHFGSDRVRMRSRRTVLGSSQGRTPGATAIAGPGVRLARAHSAALHRDPMASVRQNFNQK